MLMMETEEISSVLKRAWPGGRGMNDACRGCCLAGPGWLAVGGWRLAVGGWWRLAVGGGWRLAVGGWWQLAVGGWRLAVGSRWLVAVGSWQFVVGSGWRLAVGRPRGLSLVLVETWCLCVKADRLRRYRWC